MERKEFIKTAAIAGAGIMASTSMFGKSFASSGEKVKIALIGCGGRGTGAVLAALSCGVPAELVAMADLFPEPIEVRCKALKERVKDQDSLKVTEDTKFLGFQGYKKAIAMCDVAFITTPAVYKPLIFAEAVSQGKHVFMEKPICVDADGYRSILESAAIAKQKDLNVAGGLQRRYSSAYQEIVEQLHDGVIGDILSAECYWFGGPIGDLSRPRKDHWSEMEFQNRHWRSFSWIAGGNIEEYHVHNLDIINWVLKQPHPKSVLATGGKIPEKLYSGSLGGFDSVSSNFEYENGVHVYSYSRNLPRCTNHNGETFVGTKGRMVIGSHGGDHAVAYNHKGKVLFEMKDKYGGFHGAHNYVQKDLMETIYNKKPTYNQAIYHADSCMTGALGRMSAWSGKRLTWEEAVASDIKLFDYNDKTNMNSQPPILPFENGDYPVPVPGKTKV